MSSTWQCIPDCDPGDCNNCSGEPVYSIRYLGEFKIPNGCTLTFDFDYLKMHREEYND
jgi:hypothetical protein